MSNKCTQGVGVVTRAKIQVWKEYDWGLNEVSEGYRIGRSHTSINTSEFHALNITAYI